MNILRAFNSKLFDMIQPYKVTDDTQMPYEYQTANPKGRPLHDDWAIGKNVRRIDCAYKVPLPFKITKGPKVVNRIPFLDGYPLAPGTPTYRDNYWNGTSHVPDHLFVDAEYGLYGLCEYSAWIGEKYVPVFWKYTGMWLGKRFSWYYGLHQDLNEKDAMCWFPEVAASWIKES